MKKIVLALLAIIVVAAGVDIAMARSRMFDLTLAELRSRYQDQDSKYVTLHGVELHYKDQGTGPAIILIHGSFGNLRTWDGVVDDLKSEYRLVRIDMPPAGLSGSIPASVKQENVRLEDLIKELMDKLQIAHAAVIGVSSGGIEAFRFAGAYPAMTDALVLSNTPSMPVDADHPWMVGTMIYISNNILEYHPHLLWDVYLPSLFGDRKRLSPALLEEYYTFNRRAPEANGRLLAPQAPTQAAISAELAKVKAPTLLIWGGTDYVLPPETEDRLARLLLNATVRTVMLPDVGHYPPLEAPHAFAEKTRAFLQSLPIATQAAAAPQ